MSVGATSRKLAVTQSVLVGHQSAQNGGVYTYSPAKRLDGSTASTTREVAECLADSIDSMLYVSPPHDPIVASRKRHERTHSTRRLIRAGVLKAPPSPLLYSHTPTTYRARRPASNSRFSQTTPRFITRVGIEPPPTIRRLQRAIDELDQWFRLWRIDVSRSIETSFREHIARVEDCAFLHGKALEPCSGPELPTIKVHEGRIEAIFRHRSHPNALLRAVDYQPPPPPTISVGHGTYA
ncbi:hypothetical protein EVAR_55036_1 [Eumeta japonica]|uniref:Uncharacterized protein n=1 Tax=Eumeta variegata TaxID=151549 RepID=A0A4C1ZSE4_EUMVA|nr:hypothetical protein EVAR_55036_1 [Eumeta japonica]